MGIDVWLFFVRHWILFAVLIFDTSGQMPYVVVGRRTATLNRQPVRKMMVVIRFGNLEWMSNPITPPTITAAALINVPSM